MTGQTIGVSRILPYFMMDSVVMTDPTLSPIDKAVFGVLCVHAGIESRQCFLKVKTIATEARITPPEPVAAKKADPFEELLSYTRKK